MALLFVDGFDHYATADIPKKWANQSQYTIDKTAGRRGGGALVCSYGYNLYKYFNTNAGTFIIGYAFKMVSLPNGQYILGLLDGNASNIQIQVACQPSGQLGVYRNTTLLGSSPVATVIAGAWTYMELKGVIHPTAGSVELRINGGTVFSQSGINTRNTSNSFVNGFFINDGYPGCYWDDLYVCDNTGTANNDFLGDVRVDTLFPNAEGTHAQFTPSTGSVHYSMVSETSPNTTNYVTSNIVGAKETFNFNDLIQLTGNVKGIQVNNTSMKDDAGTRSVGNLIKSGATDVQAGQQFLGTTLTTLSTIHEVDPATGLPWTPNSINNAEFGTTVVS